MQSAYEIIDKILLACFDDLTLREFCLLAGSCRASADLKEKQQAQQQAKTEALLQKHSNIEIIKCNGKSE